MLENVINDRGHAQHELVFMFQFVDLLSEVNPILPPLLHNTRNDKKVKVWIVTLNGTMCSPSDLEIGPQWRCSASPSCQISVDS
jgi:hypothetical protein